MILDNSKKRIVSNIISLGVIQGMTYLLPLFTFPYLIRVLGADKFGLIAFSNAVVAYFGLIIDYGFNLSATQDVALCRDDNKKLSIVFSGVVLSKFMLFLACIVLLILAILFFDILQRESLVYLISIGILFGQLLFPTWLFQGMESMRTLSILTISSKCFFTLLIFIFIKKPEDYWIVPLLNAVSSIIIGVISLILGIKIFKLTFLNVGKKIIIDQLKSGWHIFISRIFVNFYSTTNTIILGLFTNNIVVANYAIAEKIIQAIEGLFAPITQGLYPYFSIEFSNSKLKYFKLFKKVNTFLFVFSLLLFLLINYFSFEIINLIIKEKQYINVVVVILSILTISIITAPFGPAYTNAMIILNQKKEVLKIVRKTAVLNFILVIPLIYIWGAYGLAFSWVLCQVFHVYWYRKSFLKIQSNDKKNQIITDAVN
jgi:PST family polysaccharide transporter